MKFLNISVALATMVVLLSACGGGGSSSSPIAVQPPSAVASPPTSNGGGTTPQAAPLVNTTVSLGAYGRATIMAVNATPAATLPPGTVLPTTSSGTISATPVNQTIRFNKTDGKYFGGSDASGTYPMDPADVDKICASSAQVGYSFLPGQHSRACAAPDLATDTVTLPRTCSRDSILYTVHMKDGSVRWLDWTSERKFLVASDSPLPGVVQADGAHVVWNGYTGATVKVVKTGVGKASVTIDFGSNCVGAFGQMNDATGTSGRLVDMAVTDGVDWLQFLFHSDKSGVNGTSGWGSQPWVDTANGYTVQPSVIGGYLNFSDTTGNYFVTIPDVPCSNAGNITAYRGTKQADQSYVYDPGTSGSDDPLKRPFGLGWLPIQADANESQLYTLLPDPSVTASFDRTKFQLVIGACN